MKNKSCNDLKRQPNSLGSPKEKKSWQFRFHQKTPEDTRRRVTEQIDNINQEPLAKPWRSTRLRNPNPKYTNASYYGREGSIHLWWSIAECWVKKGDGRSNLCFEAESDLGLDVKTQECETHFLHVGLQSQDSPWWMIERYKAQLVACRFSQHYRLDYDETFSSVTTMTTMRVLIALAPRKAWKLWQECIFWMMRWMKKFTWTSPWDLKVKKRRDMFAS